MEIYAAEYAVFSSADWLAFSESHPAIFDPVASLAGSTIYKIKVYQPGFVLRGQGTVSVLPNMISVAQAEGTLVTKLHYSKLLRIPDGVTASPILLLDDPVPFLQLEIPKGLDSFEIHLK